MSQTVDLSGFPVVRIDQIPLIDSDTLVQAQKDVKGLIASMLAESDTVPPMVHYLRKQNEATAAELMNRLAQERINSLLNGATALLNNDRSKYVIDDEDPPPVSIKPSADKIAESTAKPQVSESAASQVPAFQALPLPSEVRAKRVSALATVVPIISMNSGDSVGPSTNTDEQISPLSRSKSSPAGIALSSSRSTSERSTKRTEFSHDENAGSESSPPRRRPMSGDIRPSKRSQEFINSNFGSLFIVAGDGRRRRPLVKKAPAESTEVIKAREKLERRKAAMQRLLDRKEEQRKMQLAKREAKRAAQREAELNSSPSPAQDSPSAASRSRKVSRSTPTHVHTQSTTTKEPEQEAQQELDRDQASSGSESVSGGDEEMEVEVDEKMVSAVALAQQQAAQEVSVSGENTQLPDAEAQPSGAPTMLSPVSSRAGIKSSTSTTPTSTNATTRAAERKATISVPTATTATATERVAKRSRPVEKNASQQADSSREKPTPKATTTSKRKSAYRMESASKEEEDPAVQKIVISQPNLDTHGNTVSSEAAIASETDADTNTEDQREAQVHVTGEDLVAEFEAKNFAALQSLRSMKLKKEQQRLSSLKTAPVKPTSASALVNDSAVLASPQLADLESVTVVDDDKGDHTLTRSVDDFPPVPSFSVNESSYYESEPADTAGAVLIVPQLPARGSDRAFVPQLERPPSRVVRSTVSVVAADGEVSATADPTRAVSAPTLVSPRPTADSAPLDAETTPRRRNSTASSTSHAPAPILTQSVDLSQTTLSMTPDLMSPVRKSVVSVVGPRDPIVTALLAGAKHSHFLYLADGVYCCEKGPEALPGLCAWKLASIVDECANWVVNINKYTEAVDRLRLTENEAKSEEFVRRAATRKSVSLGLLVLLLDCEDLLLGTVRLFNAEHFTTLWKEYIRLFDEKAESAAAQWGAQALFTQVGVCGNCHAVCKKLENILKTIFVPKDAVEARLHRKLHAQEGSLPVQVGCLIKPLDLEHAASDSARRVPLAGHDDAESAEGEALGTARGSVFSNMQSAPQTARSATSLDYSHDQSFAVDRAHSAHQALDSVSQLDDSHTMSHDSNELDESSLVNGEIADLEGSDIDDEASILPVYQINLGSEERNIEESAHNITERFLRKPVTAGVPMASANDASSHNLTPVDRSTELRQDHQTPKKVLTGASSVATLQSTTSKKSLSTSSGVQLSDFYPSIGCIFPAVYGLNQTATRQADDGSAAARGLIESMQVQCKIYEEWMEVMSDYSTVFSDDRRGVAENYYGSGGGGGAGMSGEKDEGGGDDGAGNSTVYKGGTRSLHFRVKSARSEVNNIVSDVFNNFLHAWEELPAGLGLGLSWNVLWTWSKPRIKLSHLLIWQRVNHYPDSKELTRKDLLKKNIQRYTVHGGKGGAQFDIMPLTYLLPHEYTAFVQAFTAAENAKSAEQNQNFWILKPLGMSRGRGISLVKDLSQIAYSVASVVQKYIERPLCLKGYKFDLRLYILVTSFKPLEAFIYRDGFARVSTHQYSLNPEDTENKFIHLTNSSIQVQNTEGPTKDSPLQAGEDEEDTGGTKISLLGNNGLWKRLEEFGIDIPALWQSISSLVIKSLVMVDDKMVHQPCCFEMFGYDVLIDADLRPWLLEVNASPSLARPSPLDVRVKNAMIRDIIGVLDPAPYDRAAVLRILQKRLANISKNRFAVGKNDPELESDLREILGDYVPRAYGAVPTNMGNYEMLAPNTKEYERVLKLKKKIIKS